jgi:hypothetical protein
VVKVKYLLEHFISLVKWCLKSFGTNSTKLTKSHFTKIIILSFRPDTDPFFTGQLIKEISGHAGRIVMTTLLSTAGQNCLITASNDRTVKVG